MYKFLNAVYRYLIESQEKSTYNSKVIRSTFPRKDLKIDVKDSDTINIQSNRVVIRDLSGRDTYYDIDKNVDIVINGNPNSVVSSHSVNVNGNIHGNVSAKGSIKCKDIMQNVNSKGSVKCHTVHGNITASGSVNIKHNTRNLNL